MDNSPNIRINEELEVFEGALCGLGFLTSFDHIRDGFYENPEIHGQEIPEVRT